MELFIIWIIFGFVVWGFLLVHEFITMKSHKRSVQYYKNNFNLLHFLKIMTITIVAWPFVVYERIRHYFN